MEIKQVIVFTLDDRKFALPLANVERVIRAVEIAPLPKAPEVVMGVIDLHGRIMPVVNVRKRFGLPEREIEVGDQIIISTSPKRTFGLVVNETSSVVDLAADDITVPDRVFPGIEYIEGITRLENDVVLIHDIDKFLSLGEEKELMDAVSGVTLEENV